MPRLVYTKTAVSFATFNGTYKCDSLVEGDSPAFKFFYFFVAIAVELIAGKLRVLLLLDLDLFMFFFCFVRLVLDHFWLQLSIGWFVRL